ncbi:uncharacterized protein LOC131957420 [Physella acuta]|uniref:uncharacterized protein LOC131957420 n=1 Tax=Physella acuta TaxID=109671 RepID=UPI0027DDBD60|nr:uncharacterized protein LOC131957420 [Physella acuta]
MADSEHQALNKTDPSTKVNYQTLAHYSTDQKQSVFNPALLISTKPDQTSGHTSTQSNLHGTRRPSRASFLGSFSASLDALKASVVQVKQSSIDHWPLLLLTVVTALVTSALKVFSLVFDQYVYSVYAKDVFGGRNIDTRSHPCLNTSDTSPNASADKDLVEQVQDMTSNLTLYLDVILYVLGMVSNMALGACANLIRRKVLLLAPLTGFFIKCATLSSIIYWELSLDWLYMAYAVDGICGNSIGMLLGSFLYTSDITSRDNKRTLGVAIVEAAKGVVSAAVYVVAGQLIEKAGFLVPALVATGLQALAIILVCFLPDRKPKDLEQRATFWSVSGAVREMLSPFLLPENQRLRRMSLLAALTFCVLFIARTGVDKIRNLYLMNLPFCFDAITIGWFMFARDAGHYAFTVFAVSCLYRCLPGFGLGILGTLSNIAAFLMYAFAQNYWQIYIAPVLGFGETLTFTVIRGEGSRLLGPEYQASWFASLAVLESISLAISAPVFIPIYTATLGGFTGSVYVGCAGVLLVVLLMKCIYQVMWVRHMTDVLSDSLEIGADDSQTSDQKKLLPESKDQFTSSSAYVTHL